MDAVLRILIAEVALFGTTGFSTLDFRNCLAAYHKCQSPSSTAELEDLSNAREDQPVEEVLCAQTWNWLIQHPDISVGTSYDGLSKAQNLRGIEASNRRVLDTCRANHENDKTALSDQTDVSLHCAHPPHSSVLKLFASEDQIWHAAAGHGVDYERLPAKDFECLSVIAAHREKGVLQPALTRLTGQDVRSVPQRTQRLCDAGYIVKLPTLAPGARTSLLVLTRFAAEREKESHISRTNDSGAQKQSLGSRFPGLQAELSKGRYDGIMDKIDQALRMLQSEKIIVWDDLKKRLEIFSDHDRSRLFAESVRIMESAGAVQRVKAHSSIPVLGNRLYRSVQFVRAISEEEVRALLNASRLSRFTKEAVDSSVADQSALEVTGERALGDAHEDSSGRHQRNISIQWSPHRQLTQQFREVVDDEGNDGVTFPDIRDNLVGALYQKPLETQASRILDSWKQSQPIQLRHLGVMRDTIQLGKATIFVHYARHRLNSLLRSGQVSAHAGLDSTISDQEVQTDSFGFVAVNSSAFADKRTAVSWNSLMSYGIDDRRTQKSLSTSTTTARHDGEPAWSILPRPRGRPRKKARGPETMVSEDLRGLALQGTPTLLGGTVTAVDVAQVPNPSTGVNASTKILKRPAEGHSTYLAIPKRQRLTSFNVASTVVAAVEEDPLTTATISGKDSNAAPVKLREPARDSKLSLRTYFDQASAIVRKDTGCYAGDLCELKLHRRGRGPRSRLVIVKTPLLHRLEFFEREVTPEVQLTQANDAEPITDKEPHQNSQQSLFSHLLQTPATADTEDDCVHGDERGLESKVVEADDATSLGSEARSRLRSDRSNPKTGEGSLAAWRRGIILEIVEKSGGAYPGNSELWFPFTTAWNERYPKTKPDNRTIRAARKSLVDSGKLRDLTFNFKTKVGTLSTKTILFLPGLDAESERVKELQEKMISEDPKLYFPPGPTINPGLRKENTAAEAQNSPGRAKKESHEVVRDTVDLLYLPRYARKLLARLAEDTDAETQITRARRRPGDSKAETSALRALNSKPPPKSRQTTKGNAAKAPTVPPNDVRQASIRSNFRPVSESRFASPQRTLPLPQRVLLSPPPPNSDRGIPFDHIVKMIEQAELQRKKYHLPNRKRDHFARDGGFINLFSKALPEVDPVIDRQAWQDRARPGQDENASRTKNFENVESQYAAINAEISSRDAWKPLGMSGKDQIRPLLPLLHPNLTHEGNSPNGGCTRNPNLPETSIPQMEPHQEHIAQDKRYHEKPERLATLISRPKKLLRGPQRFRLEENIGRRLFIATILTKTLTGGLDQHLNWVIVAEMLHSSYPPHVLKKRWNHTRHSYRHIGSYLQYQIREVFLKGYEDGGIPGIDFENLGDYDWSTMYDYVADNLDLSQFQEGILHLQTSLGHKIDIERVPVQGISDYHDILSNIPRRTLLIHKDAYVQKLADGSNRREVSSLMRVAKNWVRANIAAAESSYNADAASTKLRSLGNDVVQKAIEELLAEKAISQRNKGRPLPGRAYDFSEAYMGHLASPIDVTLYRQAIGAKRELDVLFQQKKPAPLEENVSDGFMLAVINMLAQGHIRALQDEHFLAREGLAVAGYKKRDADESRLMFNIELVGSEAYMQGNPLSPLPPAPQGNKIYNTDGKNWVIWPLWYDINGSLVDNLWALARCTIVSHVALKSGITTEQLQQAVSFELEDFEIKLVLEWMVSAGVAEWLDESMGSVRLGEWWWMILDDNGEPAA